jgi:glycine/D-amino acid oxidase-like deaminating enzyme
MNNSPWIAQLNLKRKVNFLNTDEKADILIIGGGIAGVSTAYYLLKNTNLNIGLIEGGRIAHGASGHNAGQVVGYFERPFADIVKEFGMDLAVEAQLDINSGWDLLDEIFYSEKLVASYAKINGYAGTKTWSQAEDFLENKLIRDTHNASITSALISKQYLQKNSIPEKYSSLLQVVDEQEIWDLLETKNTDYFAAFGIRKGVLNSAEFSEEIVNILLTKYPERFRIWEDSLVKEVILGADNIQALSIKGTIQADKVILCTNGFEHIKLTNKIGQDINKKFRKNIIGRIGYMAGYLEERERGPMATSYIQADSSEVNTAEAEPYYYLTRRNYDNIFYKNKSLVCIGGPESELADKAYYQKTSTPDKKHYLEISNFLIKEFKHTPNTIDYDFKWHGLMGYTENGIRMVGPEKFNSRLLYNLGCNGIGILPSIFGGWKISEFINNKVEKPSIFDPI